MEKTPESQISLSAVQRIYPIKVRVVNDDRENRRWPINNSQFEPAEF